MAITGEDRARPISASERSGMLYPRRLERYSAGWIAQDPAVTVVVDQYWHVSLALDTGERLDQPIIDLPAVNVTIEEGDVPAPLVVTGIHARAWRRTIRGTGQVFAVRLRPAGLAVLSDLTPGQVADATVPLTTKLDSRLHTVADVIATCSDPADRARAADRAIGQILLERPPTPSGLLANDVMDELRERIHRRTGSTLAERFSRSDRTIQRACMDAMGHGPKWLSRRIRLQEVARALAVRPGEDLAVLAAELGYTDQSHLTRDFSAATGLTPNAYRRAADQLTG